MADQVNQENRASTVNLGHQATLGSGESQVLRATEGNLGHQELRSVKQTV
ncbi:unnamed protein product [Tetraodon nigroviridis]|uniref:(spotted green pufferfish) hypothetical protein n=1 Tax=Tetraodon nigroviridis TaxID=99883 RepID=Q4T4A2_TETNG|nr:unnamed protein product [Tetraodon nigroviridis]